MQFKRFVTVGLLPVTLLSAGCLGQQPMVPVRLDVDADHGACSTGVQVVRVGTALHVGPGADFAVVIPLDRGRVLAACEAQDGWIGVIVGTDERCGIGQMVLRPEPVGEACLSGWVREGDVQQIFG